ncbi:hypothetical protein BGI30_05575 [Snodgrassella alvi]|uniref:Uncharacterized protein n=1 Tax=Snodgrassella alvi TaxID=1196083 RepID=A0A855FX32_9NEIS|nr:hypothetical protein BGI30_05575 [Snodgrassella alvi]PIT27768.1 hypothetical protein BGI37_03080 [Snodgrassella alvi]PIT45146.1 hypothetical protein BHC51_09305 [Snodgrassella alvi]PIT57888.1 hypothetical protein BHC59_03205 [Snodgrassella alvi]PIT60794.1 hypothetical protein BHC57_02970 [Snodgrassella alvi]
MVLVLLIYILTTQLHENFYFLEIFLSWLLYTTILNNILPIYKNVFLIVVNVKILWQKASLTIKKVTFFVF